MEKPPSILDALDNIHNVWAFLLMNGDTYRGTLIDYKVNEQAIPIVFTVNAKWHSFTQIVQIPWTSIQTITLLEEH